MHRFISKSVVVGLLAALLLGGCASQVPLLIRQAPPDNPTLAQVRGRVEAYVGQSVRWGGLLIATDNRERSSRLTLLAWPLGSDGEPRHSDDSDGRFIAIVPAFLDPAVYAENRLVTVTGTLVRSETELVGEHPYAYPVVEAQAWYLWPEPVASTRGYYPGWYDPWYGPWGYSPWYDPWYSPHWYPYRYPYWRAPVHPKPLPGTHPKPVPPEDGADGHKHKPPRPGDHQPGDRPPRADGPRKLKDGTQRPPRHEPRGVEHAPPGRRPVQEPVMDQPAPAPPPVVPPAPAGDGDAGGALRRFFRR